MSNPTGSDRPEGTSQTQGAEPASKPEDIVKTTFRLHRATFVEFKSAAAFRDETMSAAITRLMSEYSEKTEKMREERKQK